MDEKDPLIGTQKTAPSQRRSTSWSWFIVTLFVLTLLWHHPQTNKESPSSQQQGQLKYAGENITWEACGEVRGSPLECTRLEVPMDQYNNTDSDMIFSIPLIRLRGEEGAKTLFLNVGGPGGSGVEYMKLKGDFLATVIGKGYHILSFDPRGVAGSEPKAHCYADADSKRSLHEVQDTDPIRDSPGMYAWTQNFVKSCLDSAGEHGKYINTVQTAADMNSILDAIGQKNLVYWGWSYGTVLGQTYATLFPDRVERIMMDGICDNVRWYNDRLLYLNELVDADAVLDGFFEECIKAGDRCSLTEFATTKDQLKKRVMGFVENLDAEPLGIYVNNTHWGTLTTKSLLTNGLFIAMYKPSTWLEVANRISKMLKGNATEAFLEYGSEVRFYSPIEDSNDIVCANDGVTGPEHFPQSREDLLDLMKPGLNISSFISAAAIGIYKKALWKIPKTHEFKQKPSVKTAHPVLIFSSTYDPVTPLRSAEAAKKIFIGSEIVQQRSYGHAAIGMPSKCVSDYIRAYLYNGTVPEEHAFCDMDGTYFEEPKTTETSERFETEEHRAIYRAQLEIAKDRPIPFL